MSDELYTCVSEGLGRIVGAGGTEPVLPYVANAIRQHCESGSADRQGLESKIREVVEAPQEGIASFVGNVLQQLQGGGRGSGRLRDDEDGAGGGGGEERAAPRRERFRSDSDSEEERHNHSHGHGNESAAASSSALPPQAQAETQFLPPQQQPQMGAGSLPMGIGGMGQLPHGGVDASFMPFGKRGGKKGGKDRGFKGDKGGKRGNRGAKGPPVFFRQPNMMPHQPPHQHQQQQPPQPIGGALSAFPNVASLLAASGLGMGGPAAQQPNPMSQFGQPSAPLASLLSSSPDLAQNLLQVVKNTLQTSMPQQPMQQQIFHEQEPQYGYHESYQQKPKRDKEMQVQYRRLQCIVVVCKVPPALNSEGNLRPHFEKYGRVMLVLCSGSKAYVVYEKPSECQAAKDSTEAILGNRRISLIPCNQSTLEEILKIPLKANQIPARRVSAAEACRTAAADERSQPAMAEARLRQAETKRRAELAAKEQQIAQCQEELEAHANEDTTSLRETLELLKSEAAALQASLAEMLAQGGSTEQQQQQQQHQHQQQQGGAQPWWASGRAHTLDFRAKKLVVTGFAETPGAGFRNACASTGEIVAYNVNPTAGSVTIEMATRGQAEKCRDHIAATEPSLSVTIRN